MFYLGATGQPGGGDCDPEEKPGGGGLTEGGGDDAPVPRVTEQAGTTASV